MQTLPAGSLTYRELYHSPSGITVAYKDDWTQHHALEGDGLCPLLYHHLSKNIKGREHQLSIQIPETVVFELNFPRAWYSYDAESKEIIKRPGRMLDAQTMYSFFSKPSLGCDIVAQFFYTSVDVMQEWSGILSKRDKRQCLYRGQQLTYVQFFTAEDLHDFLFQHSRKPDGVLQKFVSPKNEGSSRKNFQMQVLWSPLLTTVYRRTNRHRLDDYTVSLSERAATYDGAIYLSDESIVADETKQRLSELCAQVAEHFFVTEAKRITRLNLFFKVDKDNRIWLLWCGSVRVEADALDPSYLRVPMAFAMRTQVRNDSSTSIDMMKRRRLRQKQLLALDYDLYTASNDTGFALNVSASHRSQAKALRLKGLRPTTVAPVKSNHPRYNPHHPLYKAFQCVMEEDDKEDSDVHPDSRAGYRLDRGRSPTKGHLTRETVPGKNPPLNRSDEEEVEEEMVALAMDAWYAVYSSTLADDPSARPATHIELAEPLVGALFPEELEELTRILGIRRAKTAPEETAPPSASSSTLRRSDDSRYYVIPSHIVAPGRRLDRPSAQVESDVRGFLHTIFQQRGSEITQKCVEMYAIYFE